MSTYTDKGVDAPSVTTVLGILDKSDALIPWAVKTAISFIRENARNREAYPTLDALLSSAENNWRDVKETAADIGTEIHGMIEQYIKHGQDAVKEYRPEVEKGFLAFLEWEKANGVTWEASEMMVFHPTLFYAGTLDAVAVMGGKRYVIDFKSSKGFYSTYGKQIAAYREAHGVMTGKITDGCAILRLDKVTGEPEFKDYTKRQDRDFKSFSKLLDFWYSDAKRKLKNNPRVSEGEI